MKSQGFIFHIEEEGMNGYDFFYHRKDPKEYLIGRALDEVGFDSIQVQLHDETVSTTHCRLFYHPHSGWLVEDLSSENGTWIKPNGEDSQPFKRVDEPTPIDPYSILQVGNTAITLRNLPMADKPAKATRDRAPFLEQISA
jgi:pSer/pThr/pTyr-binding forkhead associated (FHA) protein